MNTSTDAIRLSDITTFLRSRKWQQVSHPNQRILYFESPHLSNGDFHSVVIPSSEGFSDYDTRIAEALSIAAEVEGTTLARLIESFRNRDNDTLRTRLFHHNSSLNSIRFSLAVEVIDQLKSFLGFAAYSQTDPKKFISRTGKPGSDFANHCRFGHTFEGSFGLKIECPLPSAGQMTIDAGFGDIPFERQVMQRIGTGYNILHQCLTTDNADLLVNSYEKGFNANMLESLSAIYEKLDGLALEYSIDWSPVIGPDENAIIRQPVRFTSRAYEMSVYAAKELIKEKSLGETTVVSRIMSLTSEIAPDEDGQGKFEHVITINWEKERGSIVNLTVHLSPQDYKRACDAHKNGREIQLVGTPEKSGKFWIMTNPVSVRFKV